MSINIKNLNWKILELPAGALGYDYHHQLKLGDGGHNDDNLLGGKKGCMLLPELFAAHWVNKEELNYRL